MEFRRFGTSQSFVSSDFYQNMLKYAAEKNFLDFNLTIEYWGTPMMLFYADDLFPIFPQMREKYGKSEKVQGRCRAATQGIEVYQS